MSIKNITPEQAVCAVFYDVVYDMIDVGENAGIFYDISPDYAATEEVDYDEVEDLFDRALGLTGSALGFGDSEQTKAEVKELLRPRWAGLLAYLESEEVDNDQT